MIIDLASNVSSNMLTFLASGFFAKRISNHYAHNLEVIKMKHELRKLKIKANAKNKEMMFDDLKDARSKSFKFSRRAIVLSIFWLSAIILFVCAYLSIPIIVPHDQTISILWGLFHVKKTMLTSVNGFLFDYKAIAHQSMSIIAFYMGVSISRG